MNLLEIFYKRVTEGVWFLIVIILLFNLLTDFAYKIGLVSQVLEFEDLQYYGFLSSFLGVVNLLSNKFFGFSLIK